MSLSAGTKLGPYEIGSLLGAGGMGEVYRANDPRLGREVAIKVLPERLAKDPAALARFEREARAVAALSHPNILAIHDFGSENGVSYVVTELLEGSTLRSRLLDAGPSAALPWRKVVEIGAAVAEGLAAAHAKSIVHGDIKPENLFLTLDGRVKILDFGLARTAPPDLPSPSEAPTETATSLIMGTVGYMSPEQVRGEALKPSSDIFSLGCVLYEMTCGQRPFARGTGVQTIAAIVESDPVPLSSCIKDIPLDLERLIQHCLEKAPGERFQSARDLGFALKAIPAGAAAPVPAPAPAARQSPAPAWWGVAGLVLLLAAVGAYWLMRPSGPIDSLAVLPFVNAGGDPGSEYLSDGITESLINSLSQVPNLAVMSRNAVFRYKGHETDAQAAGRALQVRAVLTGRVVQRGDGLSISAELIEVRTNRHLWGEQYTRKLTDILTVQEEISTQIFERLRFTLTGEEKKRLTRRYTDNTAAYQMYLQGRYHWNKKTPEGFDKGIEYFQKAIEADPNYAPAYAGLAALYNNLANYNFALMPPREAWVKTKAAAERALQIDDSLAAAHASLALVAYQWEWDWSKADREFRRALELDPGSSSTYEPGPSSTNHWYAHYLLTMGRTEEAFRAGRRALDLDPLDLANNSHQGWHYVFTRQYAQAIEPLQKTIELNPQFHIAHWYLGLAYEQQGAFPQAIAQFQESVRITGDRPAMVALLGHAYAAAGRTGEAQAVIRQLTELSKHRYVPSYPIAAIYAGLGQKEEAFTWLEKAYGERDSWMDYLGLDPRLDGLRTDPRFTSLLRRMKLAR